jgi:hypothetical protein
MGRSLNEKHIETTTILKCGDAFISHGETVITVRASQQSYSQVRSVMLVLNNDYGIPVHFVSEQVAEIVERRMGNRSDILTINGIKVNDKLKMFISLRECPNSLGVTFLG